MTYKDEIKRVVLTSLLDKYPAGTALNDKHWYVAYEIVRANQILDTIAWKIENLTVAL